MIGTLAVVHFFIQVKADVTEEVSEVPGVTAVEVDLAGGRVTVQGDADDAAVRAAVAEAGYQVVDPRP